MSAERLSDWRQFAGQQADRAALHVQPWWQQQQGWQRQQVWRDNCLQQWDFQQSHQQQQTPQVSQRQPGLYRQVPNAQQLQLNFHEQQQQQQQTSYVPHSQQTSYIPHSHFHPHQQQQYDLQEVDPQLRQQTYQQQQPHLHQQPQSNQQSYLQPFPPIWQQQQQETVRLQQRQQAVQLQQTPEADVDLLAARPAKRKRVHLVQFAHELHASTPLTIFKVANE